MPGVDLGVSDEARTRLTKPLSYTGLLDSYKQADLTPVIGREYHGLQIVDLLKLDNSDALIRDLAVTGTVRVSLLRSSLTDLFSEKSLSEA